MRVDLRVCCCCCDEEEIEVIDDSVFIKPGIVEDLLFFLFGSSSTRTSLLGAAFATSSKVATDTAGNIPSYRISKSISGATCDFSSIISTLGWVVVVLISLFFFFSDDGSGPGGARITIAVATGNCGASNNLDTTPSDACDCRRPREGEKAASPPIWAEDNTAKDVTARTIQRRRLRCLIEQSPPFASLIVLINLTGVRLLPPAPPEHLFSTLSPTPRLLAPRLPLQCCKSNWRKMIIPPIFY